MPFEIIQGKTSKKIELIGLSTCTWCRKTKQFLAELNVQFSYIYLDLCETQEQDTLSARLDAIDEEWAYPVVLFDESVMVVGFDTNAILKELGISEPPAKYGIKDATDEEIEKTRERLEKLAPRNGYHLNPDRNQTGNLIAGLHTNRKRYGYWACPCRLATGDREKDADIFCPCDYMKEDLAEFGCCFCALYVSDDVIRGEKTVRPIPERRKK